MSIFNLEKINKQPNIFSVLGTIAATLFIPFSNILVTRHSVERSRERSRVRQLYHMGCGSDDDPCRSFSIPYKYHKFTMFNITIAVYRPRSRVMSYIK